MSLPHNVDFRNFPTDKHVSRQSKRLIKFTAAELREVDLNPVASGDTFRLCLVLFQGLPSPTASLYNSDLWK